MLQKSPSIQNSARDNEPLSLPEGQPVRIPVSWLRCLPGVHWLVDLSGSVDVGASVIEGARIRTPPGATKRAFADGTPKRVLVPR